MAFTLILILYSLSTKALLSCCNLQAYIHRQCIPQYVVGHADRLQKIRQYISQNILPLDLIGASFDGVSVNDCIHNAHQTVDNLALSASNAV